MIIAVVVILFYQAVINSCLEIENDFNVCDQKSLIQIETLCNKNFEKSNCINHFEKCNVDDFVEFPINSSNFYFRSTNGNFYNNNCSITKKIHVYRNLNNCFKDVLVKYFLFENGPFDGFLTQSGIIRKKSIQTVCSLKSVVFWIKNLQFIKYKTFIELLNKKKLKKNLAAPNVIEMGKPFENFFTNFVEKIDKSNFTDGLKNILIYIISFLASISFIIIAIVK